VAQLETSRDYARLLAAVSERPAEDARWDVLADFLLGNGHPRGQLMRLQTEMEHLDKRSPTFAALAREREGLLRDHRETLLGVDAILSDLTLSWRRGFIHSASVPNRQVHPDALVALRSHPSGALLESLETDLAHLHLYLSSACPPVRQLVLRPRRPQQPGLRMHHGRVVRDWAQPEPQPEQGARGLLSNLDALIPNLERLVVRGQSEDEEGLSSFGHQRLSALEISREPSVWGVAVGLEGLLDRCPALQTLRLECADRGVEALRGARTTGLERLELTCEGYAAELPFRSVFELRGRATLKLLDLSACRIEGPAAKALVRALGQFDFVRRIKVAGGAKNRELASAVAAFNRRHA
jgi:uncharacterized protein (TIGR02996 family)